MTASANSGSAIAATRKGGSWLLEETASSEVFTPEKLSDEHRMMAQTTDEFVDGELLPALDRLENKDWKLARDLIRRAGDLGPRPCLPAGASTAGSGVSRQAGPRSCDGRRGDLRATRWFGRRCVECSGIALPSSERGRTTATRQCDASSTSRQARPRPGPRRSRPRDRGRRG